MPDNTGREADATRTTSLPSVLKRIILLRRKDGLSRSDMLGYWQHKHAPLAMQSPEWFDSTERYTQNHIGEQVGGGAFDFDGMVESWQRPAGTVGRSFPDTRAYKEVVGPDELNFVDRGASVLFFVNERVLIERREGVKVLSFVARRPDIDGEAFSARWLAWHADMQHRSPGFWGTLRGYVQNLVVPGSMKVLGRPGEVPALRIDGMAEIRFASEAAMRDALATPDYRACEEAASGFSTPLASIVVREVTLYDRSAAPAG